MTLASEHYSALIREMRGERDRLEQELSDVEDAIGVTERLQKAALLRQPAPERVIREPEKTSGPSAVAERYSSISVRWATLWFLSEHQGNPLPSSVIANELLRGGVKSKSMSFVSNVSAVLSGMKDKNEVVMDQGGWQITEFGIEVWSHISTRRKSEPDYGRREGSEE